MNPEQSKGELKKLPVPALAVHFPELAVDITVAIDGAEGSEQRAIGEYVAGKLGAILVDSVKFYGCLVLSCLEAGIDLKETPEVWNHCARANVDIWVKNRNDLCDEASIFVNAD